MTDETTDAPQSAEDKRAAQRAARDLKREESARWRPHHSTPYRDVEIVMHSDYTQKVFHIGLVIAQKSLYQFYHTLPSHNDALAAAEATIEQKFDAIEQRMSNELDKIKGIAKEVGAEPVDGYSGTKTVVVSMYTHEALRFAGLLQMYDELIQWCDALMFSGQMKRSYRSNILQESCNMLVRFARQIHVLYMQSRNAVRREKQGREKARRAKETAQDNRGRDGDAIGKPKDSPGKVIEAKASAGADAADSEKPPAKKATKKTAAKKAAAKKPASKEEAEA